MALDQSALLELLNVMHSADGGEVMRRLLATILAAGARPALPVRSLDGPTHPPAPTALEARQDTTEELIDTAALKTVMPARAVLWIDA
jgi:hypothetical protein